jgi:hypothetical protein
MGVGVLLLVATALNGGGPEPLVVAGAPSAPSSPQPAEAPGGEAVGEAPYRDLVESMYRDEELAMDEYVARDLALAAEASGRTFEEEKARWLADEAVEQLAREVRARWPGIFVEAVLPGRTGDRSVIYVKGPAPVELLDLVRRAEVPVAVVDGRPFSREEMEARQSAAVTAVMAMGFDNLAASSDVTRRGAIDIAVTWRPGLPRDPEEIRSALPEELRDAVNVTVSDTPVAVPEDAHGGVLEALARLARSIGRFLLPGG